ncbi:MAG: succinyl-CoA synthetase beta subunit, partial [Yoonia sp.]
ATSGDIIEAEMNPVMVLPKGEGVVALDALIRVRM